MGLVKFISKALKRDQNQLVIRKTDDEMTRYLKQKHIQSERKRFETLLEEEADRKKRGLNVQEKKLVYQAKINSLDQLVYDKTYVNDNLVNFDYLVDKKNYNPLGQRSFLSRWLFVRPFYLKSSD